LGRCTYLHTPYPLVLGDRIAAQFIEAIKGDSNFAQSSSIAAAPTAALSDHCDSSDAYRSRSLRRRWIRSNRPEEVSGFGRGHMTGMDEKALVGFDVEHVVNLDEKAKEGFGDKVADYDDFDVEVRKELVGEEANRMGGVGSFRVAWLIVQPTLGIEIDDEFVKQEDPDELDAPDETTPDDDGWDTESATPAEYGFDDSISADESIDIINPFIDDAGEK
jgi:hypothetical protein